MKNVLTLLLLSINFFIFSQEKVIDSCNVLSKDYIFSKSRVVEAKNKKQVEDATYSIMLNKGTTYIITACKRTDSKSDMEVQLLDNKDHILLTNFSAQKNKYYEKVTFNCNATGTYYLKYIFDVHSLPGKGVSTVGYKLNQKKKTGK